MNHAINHLLETARREHRNCRDWRIYESYKRTIAQLTADNRIDYENAIENLCEILGL